MEEFTRYYFKPSGTLNQGNTLFNKYKEPVFEAVLKKFRLFLACDYDFINHFTKRTTTHKVGKTVTTTFSTGFIGYVADSSFKFDDENIFDLFQKNNIHIDAIFDNLIKPEYKVYCKDELIAKLETSSVNLFETDKKIGIDIPCPGYYRIDMNEDYAFFVFLVAFTLARVEHFS